MEAITGNLVGILYSLPFLVLLIGSSIYFSIRMKFPQFRLFKDMFLLTREKDPNSTGLTPLQSLMVTVGGRVGVGNIAGVAAAIAIGGPGSIFWMWILALLAASMAFVESTLAQVYKVRLGDGYVGGPPYYTKAGLKCKPIAALSAAVALLSVLICGTAMQGGTISNVINSTYGVPKIVVGVIMAAFIGLVIFGGFHRIGKAASILSPIMAVVYLLVAFIIIVLNITKLPGVIAMIFSSAFGMHAMFGGIVGTAFAYGIQRGLFSNEAGMGTGAMVSGSADSTHPAKQGLIQALSVYIDTLVVCTASALLILVSGAYNVFDGAGNAIVNNLPGVEYGVDYVVHAVNSYLPGLGEVFVVFSITLFSLTCLFSFYMTAESGLRYFTGDQKAPVLVLRILMVIFMVIGSLFSVQTIFNLADIGNALMAWINIIVILLLSPKAFKVLKDYEAQKKENKNPVFSAKKTLDLDGTVWDEPEA